MRFFKSKFLLFSFVIPMLFTGCWKVSNLAPDKVLEPQETPEDVIQEKINNMTLEEKVGQLVIVGVSGTSVDDEISNLIRNKKVGGVILFAHNITTKDNTLSFINDIKSLNRSNSIPIFVSVDEEGGIVSRVPSEFRKLPSSFYIGELNDEAICYEVGSIIAKELNILGFNVDFAPVLDILSNPNNTVIGERAFGTTAELVSKLGLSTLNGLRDNGIISVVKHFPGHGDTDIDSHYGLPVVNKTIEELNNLELIPFKNAISNGVDAIMVAHIIMSKIDDTFPASLSPKIINDLLRKSLGYTGVIFTDDLTMGAISDNFTLSDASIQSINAGADILLVCHGYDNANLVIDTLLLAVQNNIISEKRLNESLYRILSLKEKYNLSDSQTPLSNNIDEINSSIDAILELTK